MIDDPTTEPADTRRSAQQKATMLELMLGQIANFCPVISRSSIIRNSTSLGDIWGKIRLHYGFQNSGAHFLDFCEIRMESDERPEDLYQRLVAFVEDNLLRANGGITHYGEVIKEDEEMTPSLENFVVLQWLQLIHADLPRLVKQRYGTELRARSLASLKPEISQALNSLLDEIHSTESSRALRTATSIPRGKGSFSKFSLPQARNTPKARPTNRLRNKCCPLCREARRPDSHYLSECTYLPEQDRRFIAKARQIANIFDDELRDDSSDEEGSGQPTPAVSLTDEGPLHSKTAALRVQVRQSPYFDAFFGHQATRITVDSGATGNMIRASTVHALGAEFKPSSQSAHQADGVSPLNVVGEISLTFTRESRPLVFEGLVVLDLDVEVLAGTPFMERNDVAVRPAKRQVFIGDDIVITYGSQSLSGKKSHAVRRAHVLRAPPRPTVLWPGEFVELSLPPELLSHETVALEPRVVVSKKPPGTATLWPDPCILSSVAGKVRIPNLSDEPRLLRKSEHFCQVRPVCVSESVTSEPQMPQCTSSQSSHGGHRHSDSISLDPDGILPPAVRQEFETLHSEFDDVFDPDFKGYNGSAGPFEAVVNMGPVPPPQRKGRLPMYPRPSLVELQNKFDELEKSGVFARPEDVGITVEYLNPSFLVKKPSGGFRLVTAFADVGRYSKPQPSLMPNVDSILRHIGQWRYLIMSDLTSAFYQIPLAKSSMKYCGVATPFRGVRVYTRSAMGMPGSETALEELMCRVLGDLLHEGIVVKLADDLFCGGDTPQELLHNWSRVLHALRTSGLRLSSRKTVVCPKSTTVLGWIWSQGTICSSPHRVAPLASCDPPKTVKGLRSFIGAYKMISRVLPHCAALLSPLDAAVAGRASADILKWSDELLLDFHACQNALSSARTITLPRPSDRIWIVTDGAVRNHGIGSTMYVTRDDKPCLAGFFSAKLRERQMTWLPCEVEALSISSACTHFGPYIVQSLHRACILTDSKPCVQAFEKLCRGAFSASPRVYTFLSNVSRYRCSILHLAGAVNIPSDFASRNAAPCSDPSCQVCSFVHRLEDSVVGRVTPSDIIAGREKLPFTSRSAWRSIQSECSDLRRTHAHLLQGTRPSKKLTDIKDVKRYLRVATVARDGLLVVRREVPLLSPRECIIVPRNALAGILTSIHLQLDHPTLHQLKSVVNRHFFALDMDAALRQVTDQCHQCASLRIAPKTVTPQSSSDPPEVVGISFAADVLKRAKQLVFVLRECVSSYTATCLIPDERRDTLRDALIRLCVELHPLDGPPAVVRTDPAPGFTSLQHDQQLAGLGISIEVGHPKNVNKNPVAEKAIRELEDELLRHAPRGEPISPVTLSVTTARLNSRLRLQGLSAREIWTQRDQFTHTQLPLSDDELIAYQHDRRTTNHPHSERTKAPSGLLPAVPTLKVGDLVYLRSDRTKSQARPRYLVGSIDGQWCNVRKFVGSQLRKSSYRVRTGDCLRIPSLISPLPSSPTASMSSDSDEDSADPLRSPPQVPLPDPPPDVPPVLSAPLGDAPLPPRDAIPNDAPNAIQRPRRQRRMPARFKDFVCD